MPLGTGPGSARRVAVVLVAALVVVSPIAAGSHVAPPDAARETSTEPGASAVGALAADALAADALAGTDAPVGVVHRETTGVLASLGAVQAGGLTVTAVDADGNPTSSAEVVLYDANYSDVGTRTTGGDGTASWTGLDPGTYFVEIYHDGEFWGAAEVTVEADRTTDVTVPRTSPGVTAVEVTDDKRGDGDGTLELGETVTVSPGVTNGEGYPLDVRARLHVGREQADDGVRRGPITIPGGETGWFGRDVTLARAGTYSVRVQVESNYSGFGLTDDTGWQEAFTVEPVTVAGTVTDADSGEPVEGATVSLDGREVATTGGDGSYAFEVGEAGTYSLTVERDGFEPVEQEFTVDESSDGEVRAAVELVAVAEPPTVSTLGPASVGERTATLRGAVDDRGSDGDVQVWFRYRRQGASDWQTTDRGGVGGLADTFEYDLEELEPGTSYEYRAVAGNDAGTDEGSVETFTTEEPEPATVTFTVSKKSSIEGYEFSGEPVEGATVTVAGETKTTDAEGDVGFELPPGDYTYTVEADGYETLADTLTVGSGGSVHVSVPLVRTGVGVVALSVTDESDSELPASDYRVLVDGERVEPNAEGELLLEAGDHTIRVEPTGDDRQPAEQSVTVQEGTRSSVEMALESPSEGFTIASAEASFQSEPGTYEVRIAVTDDGSPVTDADVSGTLQGPFTRSLEFAHQADGVYTATARLLTLGVYAVSVEATASGDTATESVTVEHQPAAFDVPPVDGWYVFPDVSTPVVVDGTRYRAFKAMTPAEGGEPGSVTWLVLTRDGELAPPGVATKAAKAAMVSQRFLRNEEQRQQYASLLDRVAGFWADDLLDVQTLGALEGGLSAIRDLGASVLGAAGVGYAAGGPAGAGAAVVKSTVTGLLVEIPQTAVEEHVKNRVDSRLTAAADNASRTHEIVTAHDGGPVSYETARDLYPRLRHVFLTGFRAMYTRAALMDGDLTSQLKAVARSAGTGGGGELAGPQIEAAVVAEEFRQLESEIDQEWLDSLERTRELRQQFDRMDREFERASDVRAAFGGYASRTFVGETETAVDARITGFEPSSGTVRPGEEATARVTVRNVGEVEHTFFVGYGVVDPNGGVHDNDGGTGTTVTLAPGESATVTVSWTVESDAPPGRYGAGTAVWRESDRDALHTRLHEEWRDDAFTVERDRTTETTTATTTTPTITTTETTTTTPTRTTTTTETTTPTTTTTTTETTMEEYRPVLAEANCTADSGLIAAANPNEAPVEIDVTGPDGFERSRTVGSGEFAWLSRLADGEYVLRTVVDGAQAVEERSVTVDCAERPTTTPPTTTTTTPTTTETTTTTATTTTTDAEGDRRHVLFRGGGPENVLDYQIEVTGELDPTGSGGTSPVPDERVSVDDSAISADGTVVEGGVAGGADAFTFTGEVVSLEADEGVTVYLDGEKVEPSQVGEDDGTDGDVETATANRPARVSV